MDRRFTQVEFGPHTVDVPEGGYYDRFADTDVNIGATARARVAGPGGRPDLSLSVPLPVLTSVPSQSHMGTTTMVNRIDGAWHRASVQTNMLSFAQRLLPRNVELVRHGGPLSQLLDGLGASTIMRLDVVEDAQLVLNLPTSLTAFDEPGKPR